jgi:hypothetical protein
MGEWVTENSEYVFWELSDKPYLYGVTVDIYADFSPLDAMTFELKYGNNKKSNTDEIYF